MKWVKVHRFEANGLEYLQKLNYIVAYRMSWSKPNFYLAGVRIYNKAMTSSGLELFFYLSHE